MKDDLAEDYTVEKWLESFGVPTRKSNIVLGLSMILLGLTHLWFFGDDFLEWIKIYFMSLDEVRQTPYEPIWNSGKGLIGVCFLYFGISSIFQSVRSSMKKNPNQRMDPIVKTPID